MDTLLADLTETLYSVLLGETDWEQFLAQLISDNVNGSAIFMLQNDSRSGGSGQFAVTSGIDSSTSASYASYYSKVNPWVPDHILLAEYRAIVDHEVISREELYRTEYYNDFLRPAGVGGSAGLNVSRRGGETMILTTAFGNPDPAFSTMMGERLNLLKPKLLRVLKHYQRHTTGAGMENFASDAMNVLGIGLCLIDDGLKPVMMTPAAEEAAQRSDIFTLSPAGRIRLSDETGQQTLVRMLARSNTDRTELVWTQNGCRLTLFRASREAISELLCGPMVGLIIEPAPLARTAPDLTSIGQRYGLTGAESRVLSGIAGGLSIRAMADAHNRSIETLRSQVKSVLHKTGSENQLALFRMLSQNKD